MLSRLRGWRLHLFKLDVNSGRPYESLGNVFKIGKIIRDMGMFIFFPLTL